MDKTYFLKFSRLIMIKNLNEEQRFKIINRKKIPLSVINYLNGILKDIYITLENNSGYLLDLMKQEKLTGWCFQTTESAIVFFDDRIIYFVGCKIAISFVT